MFSGHDNHPQATSRKLPLVAILASLSFFSFTAASMVAGLELLRSGGSFRLDSAAFITAAFFLVLAVGIPAILIREHRLAAYEKHSLQHELAALTAALPDPGDAALNGHRPRSG
jgi:hypothetical protein